MKNIFKNKKVLFGIGVVLLLGITAALVFLLTGNKYTVTFNTMGGNEVSSIKANENENITLPTNVTKEGYNFNGWLNEDGEPMGSTLKVTKNVILTANWISKEAETITVTFDSAGGSNVDKIVIVKGEELTLPANPTKTGYTFVVWEDSNGTPIYDKALLDGDITLTATWKKVNTTSPITYTCPSGYTLSGKICTIEGTVKEACAEGTHEYNGKCITVSNSVRVDAVKKCSTQTVLIDNNGHTKEVQGTLTQEGLSLCYYYKLGITTKEACVSPRVWSSTLNGCYVKRDQEYESSCSGSNYVYLTNPNNYVTNTGLNAGCFPIKAKDKYCDSGFTYNSSTGKCIKTINATAK